MQALVYKIPHKYDLINPLPILTPAHIGNFLTHAQGSGVVWGKVNLQLVSCNPANAIEILADMDSLTCFEVPPSSQEELSVKLTKCDPANVMSLAAYLASNSSSSSGHPWTSPMMITLPSCNLSEGSVAWTTGGKGSPAPVHNTKSTCETLGVIPSALLRPI